MADSNINAKLSHKEMCALVSRLEARAASVLLRDQPELQSDMRTAARLIKESISSPNFQLIQGGMK